MTKIRIGLIGDNIAASKAPRLHKLAGRMHGVEVTYGLLVPAEQGGGFDELFDRCAAGDYHGINVTYPYKERAAARVGIESDLVRAMGTVNTVLFEPGGPRGFNTDHTGFIAAWRARFEPAEVFEPRVRTLLRRAGLGFVLAPAIPRAHVGGVAHHDRQGMAPEEDPVVSSPSLPAIMFEQRSRFDVARFQT